MLEHGGNLQAALRRYGRDDWIDLSTGINPWGYPIPTLAPGAWHRLPEDDPALADAASRYYKAALLLPVAGTQAAIQALPRLRPPSRVTVSAPSYGEHARHWRRHGHALHLSSYAALDAAVDASDVVVLCNPNNPTGEIVPAAQLLDWGERLARRGGWLVVDEAFGDTAPGLSVAAHACRPGLVVLRSVGKFFGLAGLRLGFVAADAQLLRELADLLGPWTVSAPAQAIALAALGDGAWQATTQVRLRDAGRRMGALLSAHGIAAAGTPLFHWWPQDDPQAFHHHLAQRGIWGRLFLDAAYGIRLGLPPDETAWQRLAHALDEWRER